MRKNNATSTHLHLEPLFELSKIAFQSPKVCSEENEMKETESKFTLTQFSIKMEDFKFSCFLKKFSKAILLQMA